MKTLSIFKRYLGVLLIFILASQPYQLVSSEETFSSPSKNRSFGNCVWMHIDTFFQYNPQQLKNFALTLNVGKIDSVFILAKNIDGTVCYPSRVAIKSYTNNFIQSFVNQMKQNQIKVFFYFPINTDPAWLTYYSQDTAFQAGTKGSKTPVPDPAKKLINLTSKKYRAYISKLIEEAIHLYAIDGIQLDYIRYTNGFFGFSKEELAEASKRKISTSKIIDLTYQTFIEPGDWNTILNKFDEADSDVVSWAKLREDIVFDFTKQIADSIQNKKVQIGSTLVSSGATEKAYTAIHFGQNWERMSTILDFVTPMAYHGTRENVGKFVEEVCMGALSKIKPPCKIAIGIQANSTSTDKMMIAIQKTRDFDLGFVLFRVGTFAFSIFDFLPDKNEQTVFKLIIQGSIEGKNIKGFELRNTGNILTFLTYPTGCKLIKQDETMHHFTFTQAISNGGFLQLDFLVRWNLEKNKTQFSPTLILSDDKNEFPSLNLGFFSVEQALIDLTRKSLLYEGQNLEGNPIMVENNKSWISLDSLNQILGFRVIKKTHRVEIYRKNTTLVLDYLSNKCQLVGETNIYWFQDTSFFKKSDYIPLKEVMNLFRILVTFNPSENKIFCSSLSRFDSCSVYCKVKSLNPFELWLTDSSEILLDFEDLLTTSFYQEINNIHLYGRNLRILIKKDKYSFFEAERIISIITDEKETLIIPDQFSYFLTQITDLKSIPRNREVFSYKPELLTESIKSGYQSILIVNKENSGTNPLANQIYFDMTDSSILEQVSYFRLKPIKVRNLFFLTN
jgi:uncharacterized lipoprotein YddW (UPF0748 family)